MPIIIDPEILKGKPIIAGTRISVELILELLSSGMSIEEIIKEYPHLTKKSILEAIKYAKTCGAKTIGLLGFKNGGKLGNQQWRREGGKGDKLTPRKPEKIAVEK